MINLPAEFIDKYGLVVHKDGGGDSAQRTGMYYMARYWIEYYNAQDWHNIVEILAVDHGASFIRHPKQWNDPKDFSRDQIVGFSCGFIGGYSETKQYLRNFVREAKKNWYRCPNGDFLTPELLNHFDRILGAKRVCPYKDIGLVINSLLIAIKGRLDPNWTDGDVNHVCMLTVAKLIKPTRLSKLATWLYFKFRPRVLPQGLNTMALLAFSADRYQSLDMPEPAVQDALNWYFHPIHGAPPMNEIYRPIIKWLTY